MTRSNVERECCQTMPGFDTYAREPVTVPERGPVSPAKGVFAFHYVGEKFIGLFGRLATAPPLDAESAGQQSGQTTQDDTHLITHDDSLVHPHAVSKVRRTV